MRYLLLLAPVLVWAGPARYARLAEFTGTVEVQVQWSQIALLRGAARFSSPAADLELREGQTTRVEPANAARFFFYREVLPLEIDKWSGERDDARTASTSAAHIVQRYGLSDL